MSRCSPSPWWRLLLFLANAAVPIPAITLLAISHPIALPFFAFTMTVHGLLLWGILYPRSHWLAPLVQRFRASGKEVWLTIDDGPDGDKTLELSRKLKERGIAATFFCIGEKLRAQPEVARTVLADGHTLANHTGRHPRKSFWCSPRMRLEREVSDGSAALKSVGAAPRWFRPPVGHKPPALRCVLERQNMRLISWTVGGRDGWTADPSGTVQRVLAHAKPGAIIVLHETRAYSTPTILAVVDALQREGFTFCIPNDDTLEVTTIERRLRK